MPIIDSILAELDQEAKSTRRLLERIPQSKFGWKPHDKSMTLGDLAMHVATIPGFIGSLATQEGFDVANFKPMKAPNTTAELVAIFDEGMKNARKNLSSLGDDQLMAPWSFVHGERELVTLPRIALIRSILCNHHYHHRGQLSVYARLLDVPVPSIYGPSADENPFA